MSVDLLIELGWKSVLCAGLTLLALRLLTRRSAAEKSLVAYLGVLALVLLPLGALYLPTLAVEAPPHVAELIAPSAAPPEAASASAAPGATPVLQVEAFDWAGSAALLYLLVAAAFGIGLFLSIVRLQRVRARAKLVSDPRWLCALAAAQERAGFKHGTALLTSDELNSPVSWGLMRPIIIIDPAAAEQVDRAEAIIAHELAHVTRMDWLRLMLGRLAVAIFWFNPLVWMLVRQSHQLSEEAADDAVLRTDVRSADYAELLVGAVKHANRPAFLAANGVAPSRSSLRRRVDHVLDRSRPRGAARLGWLSGSLTVVLSVNLAIAAAEPLRAQPPASGYSAFAGEAAATRLERLQSAHARTLAAAIRRADWSARRVLGDTSFHEPRAVQPLIEALRDERPSVRRIATWGLSEMRPTVGDEAAAPVAGGLGDPAPEVRAQAARALGDFGATRHSRAIAALLRDPSAHVRREAAHALGDLQDPATRPALEAARADPDPAVAAKVDWALGQIADAERVLRRYAPD